MVEAGIFQSIRSFFNPKGSASCGANDLNDSQAGSGEVSKSKLSEDLKAYYSRCLKKYYRNGYADLGGRGNSEGQSYAMLQALWSDDQRAFRDVWVWTRDNLQREDKLFSWDFDLKGNLWTYPVKKAQIKDSNSATDADTDIAFALLLAGEKWDVQEYKEEGVAVARGIWENEVLDYEGRLYLLPGKWGSNEDEIVINPSYFAPAAYRLFERYDMGHDWVRLANDSYNNLRDIRDRVGRGEHNELPPNWVVLDKKTKAFRPFISKPDSYDHSYDAFRTLWRAGYDQLTSPNFQAFDYLSTFGALERDWGDDNNICSMYAYKNSRLECDPSNTGLAGPLGIFSVANKKAAEGIVKKYYYRQDKLEFPDDSFYGQSWHWFGAHVFSKS